MGPANRPESGCVVTIGAFDGVHIGHQALIYAARRSASELGCASVVVTFDRHPSSVVRPESAPALLTDLDQKLELLASTGVDYTLVLRFDAQRAAEEAEDFVEEILVRRLNSKAIVVGSDFHFGKGRRGDAKLLEAMGGEFGFTVESVEPTLLDGDVVSSTRIRSALAQGDVDAAARMLARRFEARGVVEMGDGRGRELGFPTANVNVAPGILLPGPGVYGGDYEHPDGTTSVCAISVGTRPTFYEKGGAYLLEAYLLDFDGDLYGQQAKVRFTHRVRGQERFESVDDLIDRMNLDVEAIRSFSGGAST